LTSSPMKLGETTPSIGGPSFPWEAPNVYQHLMELRAAGRLHEKDLEALDDPAFLEKYGAEEYWLRTRAAKEDGAVGYRGHAPNETGAGGIGSDPVSEPPSRAPVETKAPAPINDWSNPTLPSLAEIRGNGYLRRHANQSPALRGGFRRLCDEEELHPENRATSGLATPPWTHETMNVTATTSLARTDRMDFV